MTLRHFRIYRAVCGFESISEAAVSLGMTQPAVSEAVKELEAFYGVRLFERMNRRLYITEAGRTLLQYASSVLDQFEESVEVMRGPGACRCAFGVNVSIAETRLAAAAEAVKRALPGVKLAIRVNNTEEIERMLERNEMDFGLVDNASPAREWRTMPLCGGSMRVVCAPGLAPEGGMTVAELAGKSLLLREKGSGSRSCAEEVFRRHGCGAEPAMESVSSLSLIEMARAGFGFAILPSSLARREIAEGTLCEAAVTDDGFERYYYLIIHRNKYLTPSMKSAIDAVAKAFSK